MELQRTAHAGAFFDVVGRRAAMFGYENRDAEVWTYPLEIIDQLSFAFRLEGYPVEIDGRGILSSIAVRPESTTFTFAHAAFTVREIVFAPIDEPGVVILLDVQTVLPLTITMSFRPRLRLMWPAPAMTPYIGWDADARFYSIGEETGRYAGIVGCPLGRDASIMPYQEEPRDVPNRLIIEAAPSYAESNFIPIVFTGSLAGRPAARSAYDRILRSLPALYESTATHYDKLDTDTLAMSTPDPQLDTAFRWAKIGIDKGLATNPSLGTGLLAGFRTAGDSERPGYAWFFGRDALWTTFATTSEGAFETTKTALEFLRKYQRQDGKIPHEISQSAAQVPWFDAFPYAWASADATPLYVVAHAEYWHASGDRAFIEAAWPSVLKAYQFSAATDTDGNGLIENTNVGHGWVEGGALYPPHEEIYMQGLWVAASRGIADLAGVMRDEKVVAAARSAADRTSKAMEQTYWLADQAFYAFATAKATGTPRTAEPGPYRERRQARLNALAGQTIVDEDTVLPAVPLWFDTVDRNRAQQEIDHLGSGAIATDWGARLLSNRSALYDPLSYHYGSVWPLFTGWTSVSAYRHGRPHVGHQALMSNALLTYPGALGYVTELLSGDFATPFGRSSHHQIWSEAMVVSPVVRGLLGLESIDAGRTLVFAPSLPPTWDRVNLRRARAGAAMYDIGVERSPGRTSITINRTDPTNEYEPQRLIVAPAFATDARISRVTVNGATARPEVTRTGDVQRARVTVDTAPRDVTIVFVHTDGTDVEPEAHEPLVGASNEGLRILHAWADDTRLHLTLEGRAGHSYVIRVRSPRRLQQTSGAELTAPIGGAQRLQIRFEGNTDYVRRELTVPLSPRLP